MPSQGPASVPRPGAAWLPLLLIALASAGLSASPAAAQTAGTCPLPVAGQPFRQPAVLRPGINGVLSTNLVVDLNTRACIPTWDDGNAWSYDTHAVRSYGVALDPSRPDELTQMIPGPTLRIRKTYLEDPARPPAPDNPIVRMGDQVQIELRNELPNNSLPAGQCLPVTYAACEPTPGQLVQCVASKTTPQELICPTAGFSCNHQVPLPWKPPECFHGEDVTNLHFHGSHTSPQPPHDYVLLNLYSANQHHPPPPPADIENATGEYQYSLDPLPWNQSPGTHWYHPHKHGSTAIQVLNGMAGALLVQGPFDDWLYGLYQVDPDDDAALERFEKVMVVQTLAAETNLFHAVSAAPQPIINGLASPRLVMRPGEVQRWRLISATVNQNFQAQLYFEGFAPTDVRQIAHDGNQFAPENYARQPFLVPGIVTDQQTDNDSSFTGLSLSPGNRMDFLIKAPSTPGTYYLTYNLSGKDLPGNVQAFRAQRLASGEGVTPTGKPTILSVVVEGEPIARPGSFPITGPQCEVGQRDPWCFPELPYYLQPATVQAALLPPERNEPGCPGTRCVGFSMTAPAGKPVGPGNFNTSFWIDGMQYRGCCSGATMELDTAETWYVSNDSPVVNHPFHIHINPFLLYEQGSIIDGRYVPFLHFDPPVWMDTVALPKANNTWDVASPRPLSGNQEAQKVCPGVCQAKQATWNRQWRTTEAGRQSVCGCATGSDTATANGYAKVQHLFADFTGAYVVHCHFLGHEDRGMMINVQTICPGSRTPGLFGRPQPTLPDNCSLTTLALPLCDPANANQCAGAKIHH